MTDVHMGSNGQAPEADPATDALGNPFSPESLRVLTASAIPVAAAVRYGVRAVAHPDHVPGEIDRYWVIGKGRGPGMLFEWRDLDRTVVQFRPDVPVKDDAGKEHKYVLPSGSGAFLNHLRTAENSQPVLFVEGSKQGVAAATWAPKGWGVVAMPGCNNWMGTDLTWSEGRKVVLLFDRDLERNRNVWDAASALKEALEVEGASEVVFASLAGARAKEGLDDVLGRRPPDKRESYIARIAGLAKAKLPRQPSRKLLNPYFGPDGLLAKTASLAVLEGQPAALASGSMIALYRGGAFRLDRDREPLIEQVKTLLGEEFRPSWRATIEEYLVGELYGRGMRLPERAAAPLLNCKNGMLDLRTGQLHKHDPKYLSALQISVAWDPKATCPVYEAWLNEVIPEQAEALEEVASTMLDPSSTPQKALFLFGPSKSGKSTFLRLMAAVAGEGNTSAVTLHQLSDNRFMAAELYLKMLNAAADLSAAHIEDASLFKQLTGEDLVEADRKYGRTFRFTNRALFAFSANEIPTVSETSNAYTSRIAPFHFWRSFEGRENPSRERQMVAEELPGILVRWAGAWRAFHERGRYLPSDPRVKDEFVTRSDRVARWVSMRCQVHAESAGTLVGPEAGDTVTNLYNAFKAWVREDGSANAMSRPKFSERLRGIAGVGEVRLRHRGKNLGLNVTTHSDSEMDALHIGLNGDKPGGESVKSVGSSPLSHNPILGTQYTRPVKTLPDKTTSASRRVIRGEATSHTLHTLEPPSNHPETGSTGANGRPTTHTAPEEPTPPPSAPSPPTPPQGSGPRPEVPRPRPEDDGGGFDFDTF